MLVMITLFRLSYSFTLLNNESIWPIIFLPNLYIACVCCTSVHAIIQFIYLHLCIHNLLIVLYAFYFRNRRKRQTFFRNRDTCDTQDSPSGTVNRSAKAPGGYHYRDVQSSDISYPQRILHTANHQNIMSVDTENPLCDMSTFRPNIPKIAWRVV